MDTSGGLCPEALTLLRTLARTAALHSTPMGLDFQPAFGTLMSMMRVQVSIAFWRAQALMAVSGCSSILHEVHELPGWLASARVLDGLMASTVPLDRAPVTP